VGAKHFETSAKLNEGVEELFLELTNQMIAADEEKRAQNAVLNRSNSLRRPNTLLVEDNDDETADGGEAAATSRCCRSS
jgi:Ras-related protein Rab-21